jgi:imidazolonepropionase-like amidohydrolase
MDSALIRLTGVALLLCGFVQHVCAQAGAALALVHGTVWTSPTEPPIRDGVVLVSAGRIAAVGPAASVRIPQGAARLDCAGLTITAGFRNSHVHFIERKWANAAEIPASELSAQIGAMLTRYGVTSAFDTGSIWENTRILRDRIERGEVSGPAIRSTGDILYPRGAASGSPPVLLNALGFMPATLAEASDAAEALAFARQTLDRGADGIKVYSATWFPPFVRLPDAAIRAASEEAHRRKKPVFAHPTDRDGLLTAVRSGADIVVHTAPQAGPWESDVLTAMKEAGVALIPTLKLWDYELRHDRLSEQQRFLQTAIGQLRAWHAGGGTVLFGTDVGYMSDYDPAGEYAFMERAGMSFRHILASLTTAPAARFQEEKERGRIAPGLAADLVVLNGDPSKNVRALADVRYTFRAGRLIYQARECRQCRSWGPG